MKKILLLLILLVGLAKGYAESITTDDYLYITNITKSATGNSYYFEVCLEGSNIYSGYGVDIQLPQGLEVEERNGSPRVTIVRNIYPSYYDEDEDVTIYTHSVSPSYPDPSDKSHVRVGCLSNLNENLTQTSGTLFRVYITNSCTSTQWPLGAIKLYDVELNKVGQPYNPKSDYSKTVVMYEGESSLPLNISSTVNWGTCILPFSCALPSGVKAYTCNNKDEEYLLLTEVAQLTAYTPYILYSEAGYSGNLSGTVDANEYPAGGFVKSGYLSGAIVPQTVNSGYVLQNLSEGVKFYSCGGDNFNIPAGKCWVNIDGGSARERLGFKVENSLTGISNVAESADANAIYTLSGVRVKSAAAPGLYVVNKKKVMKK